MVKMAVFCPPVFFLEDLLGPQALPAEQEIGRPEGHGPILDFDIGPGIEVAVEDIGVIPFFGDLQEGFAAGTGL
jgi:hypothetical protein